jgi:hypothetical protein
MVKLGFPQFMRASFILNGQLSMYVDAALGSDYASGDRLC